MIQAFLFPEVKNMTITRERINQEVFERGELSRPEARLAVLKLLEIIKQTLAGGEDLLVSGFGKFQVRRKKARRGRNPQTKEDLMLRPRRVVTFHASGILRRRISGEAEPDSPPDDV